MNRFEKWSVWITSTLTVLTGVGYFVTKYLLTSPDGYAVVNHPMQPWFLKAHVVVSPLLLFALGTIAVHHVWEHWVTGVEVSRRSAVATALAVVPMVLTGYLIQVLTDQGWVRAMAISHIVFGFLYGAGLAVHTWIIRRKNGEALRAAEAASSREWERAPGDDRGPGGARASGGSGAAPDGRPDGTPGEPAPSGEGSPGPAPEARDRSGTARAPEGRRRRAGGAAPPRNAG